MYLSCLKLDPASRQVQAELRDSYQMHRTLSKAFGDEDYKSGRCLFRVDDAPSEDYLLLLVQSLTKPSWDHISSLDGYLVGKPAIKEFLPRLQTDQVCRFKLRANPTVKRNGKRLGIYDEASQVAWLDRKAVENGFQVLGVDIQSGRAAECSSSNGLASFASAIFEGRLMVTNPESFLSGLERGIGSGKGFGFGLLSIARG